MKAREADDRACSATIGERLRHLIDTQRQPNGKRYTTRQIGQAAGCSHGHIADLLAGTVAGPRVDTLVKIATFFGRDPAYLIPGSLAGFVPASEEVAQIGFRASRLDRESLLGVRSLIDGILSGQIEPDGPGPST
ncbi:helix-turn-helix domain-containing protein [Hamadaea tsunoensis]|uniref:helix-turn-helix domain-containing protein n=1 Tax=Hamadaea tsunoensis TaxID=53368 RepID=UPI00048054B4|nr:helix-turn-helix transcriptional regulator [Hamadaea tsunoensis]